MPLATRIAEARTNMTAIFAMLPSITDSQTWFYVAGTIGAVALAIGFLAAAASLIFGWRMNAEQKSATQVEIANVESSANERIEIETTKVKSAAEERIAKVESESREKIAGLTTEAELAKKERAEADKEIAIAKADAARAKEGIANAEAVSAKAGVEVARLQTVVANAEKRRLEAERALLELQERMRHRRLTGDQREKIAHILLANPKGKIVVTSMAGNDESYRYASDFDEVFRQCGWTSRVQDITEMGGAPSIGVFLEMADPSAAPPYTNTLYMALKGADIQVQLLSTKTVLYEPINLKIGYKP